MSVPVSVVIITKNEEGRLPDCLASVAEWAAEIVVVDDNSTDATRAIAERVTDRVFVRAMDIEGRHRNWAYAQARQPWVLSLDADERLTPELRDEIARVLAGPEADVYTIPRRNFIGSYWVRHGGQYPSAQLRLFRQGAFSYEEASVHPRAFVNGTTGHLTSDMIHYSYRDFAHFLQKLNGQTTLEAQKWAQDGRRMSFGKAFWRSCDRFIRTFIRKKGYKDGFIGFMVAYFAALYQIISYAKYWEICCQKEK